MKKLLSLLLTLALCAGLAIPALAAEFTDVPASHTFHDAIMDCSAKGIASGYADGSFRPAASVTRAQFCVMLSRAFYPDAVRENSTEANKALGWFVPNTEALAQAGVLKNTLFASKYQDAGAMDQPIIRYDMAQLMTNIMAQKGSSASEEEKSAAAEKIADWSTIHAEYRDAVANVYALGIIGGYSDGTFSGTVTMNRGQGCVVIYRMAEYIPSAEKTTVASKPSETRKSPETVPNTNSVTTTEVLANGEPITEENVLAIIQNLLEKYPSRSKWGFNTRRTGTPSQAAYTVRKNCGHVNGVNVSITEACGGFMSLVSDSIFGEGDANPARKTTVESARPGDMFAKLDANGNNLHFGTIASRVIGVDQQGDGVSPVVMVYDGNASGKVRYDYYVIPGTYSDYYGYYVEVWTRYPTDNDTPWDSSSVVSSADSIIPISPSSSSASSVGTPDSIYNTPCGLCGKASSTWIYSEDRTKKICIDCYHKNPAANDYLGI